MKYGKLQMCKEGFHMNMQFYETFFYMTVYTKGQVSDFKTLKQQKKLRKQTR